MLTHTDLLLAQVHAHHQAMIDEADRSRLLRAALQRRKARKAARKLAATAGSTAAEGNLAGCGERVPAPAQ